MNGEIRAEREQCDIIMKGGITSGVVYPQTVLRLAEKYRFRSIGGTSAGAIAAVVTAAAEYNRAGGGFDVISAIREEIGERLESLFQPDPSVRTIFNAAKLAFLNGRIGSALAMILSGYWLYALAGFLLALLVAAMVWFFSTSVLASALVLTLFALVLVPAFVLAVISRTLWRRLPELDFGFCPGPTQEVSSDPGLSDWLADRIEMAAGRMAQNGPHPQRPLTFGDLWKGSANGPGTEEAREIDLRVMTTNLSIRRPHTLPFMDRNHYFREAELARLFPRWIVQYMIDMSATIWEEDKKQYREPPPPGYFIFPVGAHLPVVVAARMSLSFPILFATVPLYRRDYPHQQKGGAPIMTRMLFSDGGLSSNFPVHFFDALLPSRPTFGVSLESYDARDPKRRVRLPMKPGGGIWLESQHIATLPKFLGSLVNAAKDWQDRLQSTLPGYRERIATVYLTDKEGGLNLTMSKSKISQLGQYGDRAAALMCGQSITDPGGKPKFPDDQESFDFDDHRWRRYLVAFARLEETLEGAARSWEGSAGQPRFASFIEEYMPHPEHYKQSSLQWRKNVFERMNTLMTMAAEWQKNPLRHEDDAIPRPETNMRLTPKS